ncbi:hypothetical protein mvi_65570 (plasmid) [Methylobacterium indicum]|uniref:Uncharacterized protein n=1 Tax=Methylobacterium indicum TaxID=1775910 RepID=A0A8H9CAR8_9HYPH|nr:hypothetical protein mvi_65570 [Methylobacterium indicum]
MAVAYPRQLYLRVDKPLLAALTKAADDAGENISAFARKRLREAVGLPPEAPMISADRSPRSDRRGAA